MNASPAYPAPLAETDAPPAKEVLRQWQAADGSCFNTIAWTPAASEAGQVHPAALVLAIHGLGGAGSDFRPLGETLAEAGIAVHAPDLRGQGNDPAIARRGNVGDLREVVRDLRSFVAGLAAAHPGVPLFLYGESMGAMLALHLAAGWEEAGAWGGDAPAGLILASPVIAFEVPLDWWRRTWFRVLLGLAPGFRLPVRGLPSRRRGVRPWKLPASRATRLTPNSCATPRTGCARSPRVSSLPADDDPTLRRRRARPAPAGPGPLRGTRHFHSPRSG